MRDMPTLAIILPCYYEEEVLEDSAKKLEEYLNTLKRRGEVSNDSFILFVDDGSKDMTWRIISKLCEDDRIFKGVKLSRNFGHQNALLAGLSHSKDMADIFITIDADLQDDINVIEKMVKEYKSGSEIVYGVRDDRSSDSFFKRVTANGFYKFQKLMGVDAIDNHADFRLISKKALLIFLDFKEYNLFLRAMFPKVGLKSSIVKYARKERLAGETKYPIKKMLSFAWDGISSFSVVPLRMITAAGFIIFLISLMMIFWVIYVKLFTANAIAGWASTVIPIYFIGGIMLISIGIVGEYVGKIYLEVKNRPRFIVETTKN
jgi:glycosyltransferase involved in cell wall biosynthesis